MSFPSEKVRKDKKEQHVQRHGGNEDWIHASGKRGEMGNDPKKVSMVQIMEGFCVYA